MATEQQMVWRIHTNLYRRQGADEKNQNHRSNRALDNNNSFDSFYVKPPFTRTTSFTIAACYDSRGGCSQHTHLKVANFQKSLTLLFNLQSIIEKD